MAWMLVSKEANFYRGKHCFNAKPSSTPQRWPRAFVEYCVQAGRAQEVRPPDRDAARKYLKTL